MDFIKEKLCVLYLNGEELYVFPSFDPTRIRPDIVSLAVFSGVNKDGSVELERAPEAMLNLVNNQLYDDIMDQYATEAVNELDEHVEDSHLGYEWRLDSD